MQATNRSRVILSFGVLVALMLMLFMGGSSTAHAQGAPPPGPVIYAGSVTVGGLPAPDGLSIVARIAAPINNYESLPRVTVGGAYKLLAVGPPDSLFLFRNITFHIVPNALVPHIPEVGIQAIETALFLGGPGIHDGFALTFPALPVAPTPTPGPPDSGAMGADWKASNTVKATTKITIVAKAPTPIHICRPDGARGMGVTALLGLTALYVEIDA